MGFGLIKTAAGALVAVGLVLLAGPVTATPPETLQGLAIHRNIPYVPNGHERQTLDLYVPEKGEGPFPLIVWIHGGAWTSGSKDECLPLPWAMKGYVVASINYRLSQDAKFPAQIDDCKAAVRWLRANAVQYKIDRDRLIAWGDSAGGHLASLLGTTGDEPEPGPPHESSRVQAVIDWYGRADLSRVCTDPSMAEHAVARMLGGSGPQMADIARQASPIAHVSPDDPPFLIMHGDRDGTVPVQQSEAFASALKHAHVPVTLVILNGVGHGGQEFLQPERVRIIDSFLREYLQRVPNMALYSP